MLLVLEGARSNQEIEALSLFFEVETLSPVQLVLLALDLCALAEENSLDSLWVWKNNVAA